MSGSGSSTNDTTSECTYYQSYDYTIVAAFSSSGGVVSFLACFFVIGIIILYKKYLFFTQRLILYLAIATLIGSLAQMLHIVERFAPNGFCIFGAFIYQLGAWSELLAITCIMVNVLLIVVFRWETEKLEIVYILLIFVFPLTFNWIPFIEDAYGVAGAWCWIRSHNDDCSKFEYGAVLQAILWYTPLYVVLITLTVIYVIILVKLRRDSHRWVGQYDPVDHKQKKQMWKTVRPLLWFPIIYLVSSILPLANRIQGSTSSAPVLALWILTVIALTSQGGFMALAFTLDPETFKRLKWPEFKATVKQMWSKDVKEYQFAEAISESYSQQNKRTVVANEVATGNGYIEMEDTAVYDS